MCFLPDRVCNRSYLCCVPVLLHFADAGFLLVFLSLIIDLVLVEVRAQFFVRVGVGVVAEILVLLEIGFEAGVLHWPPYHEHVPGVVGYDVGGQIVVVPVLLLGSSILSLRRYHC